MGAINFLVLGVAAVACGAESSSPLGEAKSGPHPKALPASGPICPGSYSARECPPGAVDTGDVCAMACRSDAECGPAPEWRCNAAWAWPEAGAPDGLCQCESESFPWSAGGELCDGRDNDCNGAVDDGATCPDGAACAAGTCICPPDRLCEGACVDVLTSPDHCGACNSACVPPENARALCGEGACTFMCSPGFADCDGVAGCETKGSCPVEVLAVSGESFEASLALDLSRVYWLESVHYPGKWTIRGVEKSGGAPETVAAGDGYVRSIRSGGKRIHWAIDGAEPRVVELTYGSPVATTYQEPELAGAVLAYSPSHAVPIPGGVMWTTSEEVCITCWSPQTVETLAILRAGATKPLRMEGLLGFGQQPAALIGQHVFFASSIGVARALVGCNHWAFLQAAPDAGNVARTLLAADAHSIYWLRPFGDDDPVYGIERASVSGASVERIYEGDRPFSLTLDAATVYFSTELGIFRMAKSGDEPVFVAPAARALSLATDATHVYWLDSGDLEDQADTSVRRVRK